MSKRSSGIAFEKWSEAWLLKNIQGCAVHRQHTVASKVNVGGREIWVSKRNDVFGCIDLIMVHPAIRPTFIQCTLDSSIGRKFKEMLAIPWNLEHSRIQLWQKKVGRRVVIWVMEQLGLKRGFIVADELINGKHKRCLDPPADKT